MKCVLCGEKEAIPGKEKNINEFANKKSIN